MLRAFGVGRQERQVNVDFLGGTEFDLGFFGFVAQALHGGFVVAHVDTIFFFELVGKVVDDDAVKVGAAEVRVAVGDSSLQIRRRRAPGWRRRTCRRRGRRRQFFRPFFRFVEAISQSGGRWLVNNALDFQAGDFAGVFGGLALAVIEVGRHGDNSFGDLVAQESFRRRL